MAFIEINSLRKHSPIKGFTGRFVHTDNETFSFWDIMKGAQLPEHSHPQEQTSIVVKGTFRLVVEGISRDLSNGTIAVIPANAVHSGTALTDCEIMDIFHPVREDYRALDT